MERQPNPDDPAYRDQSTRRRLEEKKSKTPGEQLEEEGDYLDTGELDQEGKPLLSEKVGPDDIILEGLEEEKAKHGERDKAIQAAGKAKRKGYLTDEDYLDRLKDAARIPLNTIRSRLEKPIEFGSNVWQDTKEWAPWYDVGGNIGALGARGIESWLTVDADNFQELGFELVQKTLDYRKGLAGEIVGEIPIVKENLTRLGNTLNRLKKQWQPVQNLDGTLSIVDDSIDGSKPLMSKGSDAIDDGYIEEIVEQGDNVIYPPGSKEADILASTQALGPGGKITDLNADKLSIDGLKKQLDDDISFELGYNPDKISKTLYKAKLKAADGTIMPSEIATPFVRHGEAFLKANPTKTLEEFPHLWWKGEAWVLKGRNRYKTVNGKKQFVRKEVQIERWTDRKARAKLGRDARSLRVKEQSAGVKKGTFAYEKVRQLRERNVKREAAGLPPLRLRDSDLDHINALRSVDYYTEGMPEDFKKLIYEDLGREGLFTGDHATNLKLREREVHRALWPELKRLLKKLGHKHTGFKTPEARYNYYKEINPKTGVTRLEEYAETVYAVEELGDDMMEQLLNTAKNKNIKSPSDPVKEALIKILGSEEDYTVFMNRLEDYPENMRKDFIIEEIKYHE